MSVQSVCSKSLDEREQLSQNTIAERKSIKLSRILRYSPACISPVNTNL